VETRAEAITSERSCWVCNYQQIGGDTFLGKCTWFSKHKREKDKEIPAERVDTGCKYYIPRTRQQQLSSDLTDLTDDRYNLAQETWTPDF